MPRKMESENQSIREEYATIGRESEGTMSDIREFITVDQAIAMLPENSERIHTFRQSGGGVLIGCDWDRVDIIKAIHKAKSRELSGYTATRMHHGLCITDESGPLFVETKGLSDDDR